ncbi:MULTISPECIES: type I secretion system permease/ATPase [Chelativorans]|uniref:Type I secretion system ATPase n=1 Tax=Chelativorans sp. (strain BNC1) TaxID=266779 RepID=Q11KQ7_CHESB|nr:MULTISPECIES: type I secretion system permease/ATPase [Chelativorans]
MQIENAHLRGLSVFRRGVAVAGVFSLALNLLMLSVPLYMLSIYDRVLTGRSLETLLMLTLIAIGALVITSVLEAARQLILSRTGAKLETVLGERVLAASLQAGAPAYREVQGLRDLGHLRQFISSPLASALFDLPVVPLYLLLVYLVHPQLGWLLAISALAILLVAAINEKLTKAPLEDAAEHGAAALRKAQAQARNAEVIRAMGMFSASVASWGADNAKALTAYDKGARRNALLGGVSHFLRLFLQIAILGYGAYLVLSDHTLSAGIIFAASMISARALGPLHHAIGGWKSLASARQSWRRIRTLLSAAPSTNVSMQLPTPQATLSAEKLVYQTSGAAEPVLKGISFEIAPGDILGVVGPSGAGKSTLARLLVGAVAPTAGVVRVGGDDLASWQPEALGPFVGYVPQDVELFSGTVAQNIARMAATPDAEKVVAAAQLANCHDLIQRLPRGYDTMLGPEGHVLSGGQRQRIALARAFYGSPRIVVLDEPNASLDIEGEQALIAALQKARAAGITCVIITQRSSVVPALTKMLVLRDGRIEAFGPKEEVLHRQVQPSPEASKIPATNPATGSPLVTARFG